MKQISWIEVLAKFRICGSVDCGTGLIAGEEVTEGGTEAGRCESGPAPPRPPSPRQWEMSASAFIFSWHGVEPTGSVRLYIPPPPKLMFTVYVCEWQWGCRLAPTLLAARPRRACSAQLSTACTLEMSSGCFPLFMTPFPTHTLPFLIHKFVFLPPPAFDLVSVTSLSGFSEVPLVHLSSGGLNGCHSENGYFIWFFMEFVVINHSSYTCY